MHPRLVELIDFIDRQRPDLERAVAEVPEADRTRAPGAGQWSVAQVLEHLVLIERGLAKRFAGWLAEHRAGGLAAEIDGEPILPRIDTARALDRSRRLRTSAAGEPTGRLSVDDARTALDEARRDLKAALASGDGLALGEVVRPHPGLGPLNMYEWIAFVGTHMARHAAQIREVSVALRAGAALAVILDMDGLMLDTEPISLGAWRAAAADLGYDLDPSTYGRMIGLGHAAALDLLRREFGDACPIDDLASAARQGYEAALDAGGIPHKPGLEPFLRFLDDRRLPRAVATSTAAALARHKLRRAGVLGYFEVVVGGDDVSRGKPDPDIFLLAAERLGLRPDDCLVLEDSEPGLRAAVAAGMRVILVPDRTEPAADARAIAYAVTDSLDTARTVIERLLDEASRRVSR
jgi:HAD superfamily hydrolase (TIGR01509 family)